MKRKLTLNCGCVIELDVYIMRDEAQIPVPDLSNGTIIEPCKQHNIEVSKSISPLDNERGMSREGYGQQVDKEA